MSVYQVKRLTNNNVHVHVPGSKSITNRALLLAALGTGTSDIRGALHSEDSEHFLDSLRHLGFHIEELNDKITIEGNGGTIPVKSAEIYVGSAGTAARFLTAMLALSDGEYVIRASEQMSRRPMRELLEALESVGARFDYLQEEYFLPFRVKGLFCSARDDRVVKTEGTDDSKSVSQNKSMVNIKTGYKLNLNIDKSSQYLSSLLMTAPMLDAPAGIKLTGSRKALSYVRITTKMMSDFGVDAECDEKGCYRICGGNSYQACEYICEPDVSAACYYYAMAAVTGGSAQVYGVHMDSMQGDIRFLEVLKAMGCRVVEDRAGVIVTGPEWGKLSGIDIDMSDFSDQTMTLAAIAPFADNAVIIRNVGHIRKQESDRLAAIENELRRMGINCEAWEDGITIHPGTPQPADIETYNDHRMAMSFAVTGVAAEGIRIRDYECCRKTFPEYFDILTELTAVN